MATEIERKFLVVGDEWRKSAIGTLYRQGYIFSDVRRTVRVRVAGEKGFLTIKGTAVGLVRPEFEYAIPTEDATLMLDTLCDRPLIEKTRHVLRQGDLTWEIDEFAGENQGLIVAEVELSDENQPVELPSWIGPEVSHDPRYFNAALAKNPFSHWKEEARG
ncbi:CYTH domain-containing protein [Oculatella sp. FACHB-28]|uniref:CYTH domain-containing protein n=1 Tax=Cyanophyceae TaxID=3028117 RepID=UPI00168381B3|nr:MULTISPECIES: CYTH domain-containing protein [Cyanophyceae]MBD2058552.1 CYTH domain-containing protein [Oculatella sp. FACHB-28]MBD2066560.1 CYTH domain-containing protein [Leptolyngbya sp. FACHB-671]